jgi:penicillin amidase
LAAELFVNSSWRDHLPGAEGKSLADEPPQNLPEGEDFAVPSGKPAPRRGTKQPGGQSLALPFASPASSLSPEVRYHAGSNNWVISGAHTASGKPLLSNDMHLELRLPNNWYEAHLVCGDFDVAGVTLPGMPYVIVGHNRHVAWGFTNVGPAVEDVFIEKFNDKGEYLTPQGWVQPEHRQEIIRVKGKPEVKFDVVVTRHGPIITSVVPDEKRQLALQWIVYKPGSSRIPFFEVNSARNWDEFRAAFSLFGAPGQNVVYADVDGHIGYQATGFVPIRASGDGSLPVPGDTDAYEWTGFIAYDEMPRAFDPPSGILATANGRITPDGYPHSISFEWDSPYRTERIYKLLSKPKKYTPADMLEIQTDVVSELDRFCAERFVYRPHAESLGKSQGGRRDHARVGRQHGGGFSCGFNRVLLTWQIERTAIAAKAWRRLEGLFALVYVASLAGECRVTAISTVVAVGLRQLRRTADGGRRRCDH